MNSSFKNKCIKTYLDRSILILDDEQNILNSYKIILNSNGYKNVFTCSYINDFFSILENQEIDLVLLDIIMPETSGLDILNIMLTDYPEIAIVIVSGINSVSTAVECIKKGAIDYIVKPVGTNEVLSCLKKVFSGIDLKKENAHLKESLFDDIKNVHSAFSAINTINPQMKKIFKYCEVVTCSSQPILISGETGTGKELIAKAIYKYGNFKGNFIPVNTAGLDTQMFTDTLFGHIKGSFTGAAGNRDGMLKSAENGILFLDEIGDIELQSQIKLLRLLQEHEYTPIGCDTPKHTNAKIILGTNKDLEKKVSEETFRKDLYYRLSMHQINLPPLRERLEDIPLIFDEFLKEACKDLQKKKPRYHPELITLLKTYSYPGNIRELHGMVYTAVSKHTSGMLSSKEFLKHIRKNNTHAVATNQKENEFTDFLSQATILPTLKELSPYLINEAMKRTNGNQRQAAVLLGITPQALSKRLQNNK